MSNRKFAGVSVNWILSIMGGIVLTATTVTALIQLNPFAWASDLRVVAGATYASLLTIKYDRLSGAEDRLAACLAIPGKNCTRQRTDVKRLLQDIEDILADKKKYGS